MKEISGVAFAQTVYNSEDTTSVTVRDGTGCVYLYVLHEVSLTPEEARHLARCLLRAAKRVQPKPEKASP